MSSVLKVEGLALNAGRKTLCEGLNLQLLPGESLAILGRNGTGKTTLLHTLLGLQQPQQGRIEVCGRDLNSWSRKELATRIGILFQNSNDEMPATVLEIALMGRYPHVSGWRGESAEDIALAQAALAQMELDDLAERQIRTLSGGERQRLALAMLLAQAPQLYLLDEPSNHLDIGFQIKVLSTLTQRMQDAGRIAVPGCPEFGAEVDVEGDQDAGIPRSLDGPQHRLSGSGLVHVVDDEPRPLPGEKLGGRPADALRRTRHDRGLAA